MLTLKLHISPRVGQKLEIRDACQLEIFALLGRYRSNLLGPDLDCLRFITTEPNKLSSP